MASVLLGCVANIVELFGGEKLLLSAASLTLAVLAFHVLRTAGLSTRGRLALIYGHLFFLILPVTLFSANLACGSMCMPCQDNMAALLGYALPSAILATTLAGLVVIPSFYILSNKKREITGPLARFVQAHAQCLGISQPRLYAVDKAQPVAFSFSSVRPAIFMSVGLLDILTKREREAVLLHELAHLRQRAATLKFSEMLLRFSPLSVVARFHHDSGKEEQDADAFAAAVQGTKRYLVSAKRKMDVF